jgi:hypothetical protein
MESEECGGRLVTGQRREAALTESLVISSARIGMASGSEGWTQEWALWSASLVVAWALGLC